MIAYYLIERQGSDGETYPIYWAKDKKSIVNFFNKQQNKEFAGDNLYVSALHYGSIDVHGHNHSIVSLFTFVQLAKEKIGAVSLFEGKSTSGALSEADNVIVDIEDE